MNVQFAIEEPHGNEPRIFVLEVNPRASRTVPFVAKTIGRAAGRDRRQDHGRRSRWPTFGLDRKRPTTTWR